MKVSKLSPRAKALLAAAAMGGFLLSGSGRSVTLPSKVDPRLASIINAVLAEFGERFRVAQTLRSVEEQRQHLGTGASMWTSPPEEAPHVRGIAVDFLAAPDPNDWDSYLTLARAVARISQALGVGVRWGGAWETLSTSIDPAAQAAEYVELKKSRGETPFVDPGHFELRA